MMSSDAMRLSIGRAGFVMPAVKRLLGVLLVALACAGCRGVHHVGQIVTRPAYQCSDCNVLLISIDTLRADHLHAYGYGRDTSPNIDRFARQAVLFEQNINGSRLSRKNRLLDLISSEIGLQPVDLYNPKAFGRCQCRPFSLSLQRQSGEKSRRKDRRRERPASAFPA